MDTSLLTLIWPSHQSKIYQDRRDVTIICGGTAYPLHKSVLSKCSNYFADLFRKNKTDCSFNLDSVGSKDFEYLLEYIYKGTVSVQQCDISSVMQASEVLLLKGLAVPDESPVELKADNHDTPDLKMETVQGSSKSTLVTENSSPVAKKSSKPVRGRTKNLPSGTVIKSKHKKEKSYLSHLQEISQGSNLVEPVAKCPNKVLYQCTHCSESFNQKSVLEKHLVMHKKVREKMKRKIQATSGELIPERLPVEKKILSPNTDVLEPIKINKKVLGSQAKKENFHESNVEKNLHEGTVQRSYPPTSHGSDTVSNETDTTRTSDLKASEVHVGSVKKSDCRTSPGVDKETEKRDNSSSSNSKSAVKVILLPPRNNSEPKMCPCTRRLGVFVHDSDLPDHKSAYPKNESKAPRFSAVVNDKNISPSRALNKINKCPFCDKLFHWRTNLIIHIRLVHSGEIKLYQCCYCHQKFCSQLLFKSHMRTHTRCPSSHFAEDFKRLEVLKAHRITHALMNGPIVENTQTLKSTSNNT